MTTQTQTSTYTTTKLPGEPIITVTIHEGYDLQRDIAASTATGIALLDQQTEPVTYIVDLRNFPMDFEKVLRGTSVTAGSEHSLYRHPMIRQLIFVSEQLIIDLSAQGLKNDAFGNINARVFKTMDDALKHARGG